MKKSVASPSKKMPIGDISLIIGVILLIIVICVFLLKNIQSTRKEGIFAERASITSQLFKNKQLHITTLKDIELIDGWMTFQYINLVFSLPKDYLKDEFQITDTKYPNISITKYIKRNNGDRDQFIIDLKNTIRMHMNQSPIKH